jgi:ribosome-associated protein
MRHAPPLPDDDTMADDGDDRPSKSELKRQMHELQALGQALLELPANRSAALDLSEGLRDALAEYHRTRSFEGKRRQIQYIGKQMRFNDPEPIREAIAAYKLGGAKESLALHEAERWREELLASDEAVTRWINQFAQTDAQHLRNLLRSARKDAKSEAVDKRHGKSYRELFQLVKQALAERSADPTNEQDNNDE